MEKLFKIDLIYLATLLAANRILIIVEIPEIVSRMGVSEFMSYEIELQNRATQNDVTLRVTNSKSKNQKLHFELLTRRFNFDFSTSS